MSDPQDLPFDDLNAAIETYQDALRRTYAVRGSVEIDEGRSLVWAKIKGGMTLFVVDTVVTSRTPNGPVPLLNDSIHVRISAAKHLGALESDLKHQAEDVRGQMEMAADAFEAAAKALP